MSYEISTKIKIQINIKNKKGRILKCKKQKHKTSGICTRHNPSVIGKASTAGITLIALIITIIVLLILAGVTIAALTGSDSAPAKANEASQKNDIGTAKDDVVLTAVNAQNSAYETAYVENGVSAGDASQLVGKTVVKALYDKYGASTTMGNATVSIEVGGSTDASNVNAITSGDITIFTTDFELIGEVDLSGGVITWGEIEANVPGIKGVPETLTMDTGETKTINATLKGITGTIAWTSSDEDVATVSNGVIRAADTLIVNDQPVNTATVTITATVGSYSETCTVTVKKVVTPQVGEVVNYSPSGTYTWDKALASADQTGEDTLNSASGQTYNVSQWKILSYDPSTKMVEMVPTTPKGSLRLQGAQGYNNAVYLLDNACSSLYGNSSKGITARSIKEEDFVKAGKQSQEGDSETTNDWTRARANYTNTNVTKADGTNVKYGEQKNGAYTSASYRYYPSIYVDEYGRIINETENTETTALKGSEQSSSIGKTDNGATNGYLDASISIQPKQTYYNTSNYDTTAGLLKDGKATVLLPNTSSTNYWVASRCVNLNSNNCNFNVRNVNSGFFGTHKKR